MKPPTTRQQKIAAVFNAEIWPLFPGRAAELLLRSLPATPARVAFDVGCASGKLSLDVAARLGPQGHVIAIDGSPPLIELAEGEKAKEKSKRSEARKTPVSSSASGKKTSADASDLNVSFHVGEAIPPFPVEDGECDLVFSNLTLSEAPDPVSALGDLARCLNRGGTLLATFPMRGCWGEFLDLYRDVLTEQHKGYALATLRSYQHTLPDPAGAARWLESAGLINVSVETMRWELLFKSAREFFFSPVVELGPLATWKQIAGGRGDEMQDVFFFVKEAIDAYFSGGPFPLTMVVGCLKGEKP